jgi:hypothetical protein
MTGRLKLGQLLVSKGHITPDQLAAALGEQETNVDRLGTTLLRMGVLEEETLVRVLAGQLGLPVARIRGKSIDDEVLECVSLEVAEKHRCLPLFLRQEEGSRVLFVAMEDPTDREVLDAIAFDVGIAVRPVLVAPSELEDALQRHYYRNALTPAGTLPPMASPPPEPLSAPRLELDEDDTDPELPPADPLFDPDFDGGELEAEPLDALAGPPMAVGDDLDELGELGGLGDLGSGPLGAMPDNLGDSAHEPFAADRLPEPATDPTDESRAASLESQVILQALAQLLVEKGVITRDEFAERVRQLAGRPAA